MNEQKEKRPAETAEGQMSDEIAASGAASAETEGRMSDEKAASGAAPAETDGRTGDEMAASSAASAETEGRTGDENAASGAASADAEGQMGDEMTASGAASADAEGQMGGEMAAPADGGVEIIGVRFRESGKTYFFDPCGTVYPEGSHVIVETVRGVEYGEVVRGNSRVKESEIVPPLRQALRISTPEDDARQAANRQMEKEAFAIGLACVAEQGLEMKLLEAEYTFDHTKLLFYFTADGRVDFRELVKKLASIFHCRIELRQVGIRDETKMMGGIGICGRPYCCHAFLNDFVQVSIKMAKEQGIALNAPKISGACGRLQCCLRYEYETYLEEGKKTPKVDSIVHTRDGDGVVVEAKPLLNMVKVRPLDNPDGDVKIYSREEVFPGRSAESGQAEGEEKAAAPAAAPEKGKEAAKSAKRASLSRREKAERGSAASAEGEKAAESEKREPRNQKAGRSFRKEAGETAEGAGKGEKSSRQGKNSRGDAGAKAGKGEKTGGQTVGYEILPGRGGKTGAAERAAARGFSAENAAEFSVEKNPAAEGPGGEPANRGKENRRGERNRRRFSRTAPDGRDAGEFRKEAAGGAKGVKSLETAKSDGEKSGGAEAGGSPEEGAGRSRRRRGNRGKRGGRHGAGEKSDSTD